MAVGAKPWDAGSSRAGHREEDPGLQKGPEKLEAAMAKAYTNGFSSA